MRQLEGDFIVQAPPQEVLSYCADLRNVFPALPGLVEVKEAAPEGGTVVINAGVSFIRGRFTVKIVRTEMMADGLRFRGHGDGAGNAVDFESELKISDAEGAATNVHWKSDARVHGPLASMGAGLIAPIINQNVELFVGNFRKGLEAKVAPGSMMSGGEVQERVDARPGFWARLAAFFSRMFSGGAAAGKS